jgi:formamidopyrimidine-DNA glycosylase
MLHRAVRAVMEEAIAAGGSTLPTSTPYADARGQLGRFTDDHVAYGRCGRPCIRCGATLKRTAVAGRTSTYCPECQK